MEYINGAEGIVSRWLQAGADGWRLDVADELPDGFLDALRARVKATDPEAIVLGEVWEDASNKESYGHRRRYLLGQQLDSVMNYPFRDAVLGYLLDGNGAAFINKVWNVVENYPPQTLRLLMNHIGTHDTERALTLLGGEPAYGRGRSWQAGQRMTADQRRLALRRMRLAALLQFALPGVPCIYYGDEAGMEGYRDPFNRHPYPWGGEDADLLDWYRRLGAARHAAPVLAAGAFAPVPAPDDVACFARRGRDGGLLCVANGSGEERVLHLPADFAQGTVAVGDGCVRDGWLILPPMSGVWIQY
jgi:glycosidase